MTDRADKITAPFSMEQVDALNAWQADGTYHPFTCGNCRNILIATVNGWICKYCPYTQNWAHDFMAKGAKELGSGSLLQMVPLNTDTIKAISGLFQVTDKDGNLVCITTEERAKQIGDAFSRPGTVGWFRHMSIVNPPADHMLEAMKRAAEWKQRSRERGITL